MRLVQPGKKGLALGFLIDPMMDQVYRQALPGWAIVCDGTAPLAVSAAYVTQARALAKLDRNAPVILFGFSAGCQSVRAALISKVIEPWAVMVLDGTHANVPPLDWQIKVWADLAERARNGVGHFIATATQMTYTKDIPVGQKGRAYPTSWVLARALGLEPGSLDVGSFGEGNLHVEVFPSDTQATKAAQAAHCAQVREHGPALLAHLAPGPEPRDPGRPVPAPEPAPPWRDPALGLGARLALWAAAECETWRTNGWGESDGPNDSPRIREYFALDFRRRLTGEGLHLRAQAWCAAGACYGITACALPGEAHPTIRVSGIELEQDAKASETWTNDPKPGDLVIFPRPGSSWFRHVGIVLEAGPLTIRYAAGNEGDNWATRTVPRSEALGFIKV